MDELLYGRELLRTEMPKELLGEMTWQIEIERTPCSIKKGNRHYCNRCRAPMYPVKANACICQSNCAYCRNCLQMGKVRACESFYHLPEQNAFHQEDEQLLKWKGSLSAQQTEASEDVIQTIKQKETRLLWAVAGAGKTEMLFSGIEYALKENKRICIASPRVDVVLELAPRIKAAFPQVPVAVLYGGMEETYAYTQLVLATTHQLFRFQEAFDVLIIDEIDAFPFHSDHSLHYAVEKARKRDSALLYLSATPDQKMQKEVFKEKLPATILPARYHGYELPVPKTKLSINWREKGWKSTMKTAFGKEIDRLVKGGKRFLVFAPNIEWMKKFESSLRSIYPDIPFEAVSAQDPKRKEKVLLMRQGKVQFLITSTILERGVTFPDIDVLVIGAEDPIFTESALVQIAGRAGRSPDHPKGNVWFYHHGQSQSMKKAIRQIKNMNRLARKKGLIA